MGGGGGGGTGDGGRGTGDGEEIYRKEENLDKLYG